MILNPRTTRRLGKTWLPVCVSVAVLTIGIWLIVTVSIVDNPYVRFRTSILIALAWMFVVIELIRCDRC